MREVYQTNHDLSGSLCRGAGLDGSIDSLRQGRNRYKFLMDFSDVEVVVPSS